jgi:hypothetical protein
MNEESKKHSFRHSAGFGKRMEFAIIAEMLAEGLDIYTPLIDDNGIDAVVRKKDGTFVEIQIKARSADVNPGDEALFAAITHKERPNYWFIFRSEGIEGPSGKSATWILSSNEFIKEASQNKSGKNTGKYSLWLNGRRADKSYAKEKFEKYRIKFELGEKFETRILNEDPNNCK